MKCEVCREDFSNGEEVWIIEENVLNDGKLEMKKRSHPQHAECALGV